MKSDSTALTVLLVLYASLVNAADPIVPKSVCPKEGELPKECICYESVAYLVCEKLKNLTDFSQSYNFDTLVIRNSPELTLIGEHSSNPKKNDFTVKSLVVLQSENPKVAGNLDELLRYPTESVKIEGSSATGAVMETIDLTHLPKSVTSISISNINSVRYDTGLKNLFINLSNLMYVQLNSIPILDPDVEGLVIENANLLRIEISNSGIGGKFTLIPKKCIADETIYIELRNNDQLADFDFANLFKNDKCKYHIDLTGSKLNPKFLTSNVAQLDTIAPGRFYLQLRDVDLECDCPLVKLYKEKHSGYIHSVKCSNGDGKYLDQIKDCEKDLKK